MRLIAFLALALLSNASLAQSAATPTGSPGATSSGDKVIASGTLPSEAMKANVLSRLRDLYGADKVVDQLQVDHVVTPANWEQYVTGSIGPNLKQVSHGEFQINGNVVRLNGEVPNELQRQKITSDLADGFNRTYVFHTSLKIGSNQQQVLDQALANRVVEFESGSAVLTPRGRLVLDQMAAAITQLHDPKIAIIGNTDSVGDRQANVALSLARANAVKAYMVTKQIPAETMTVSGNGPDQPIADNATADGRARNRRIDFKIQR